MEFWSFQEALRLFAIRLTARQLMLESWTILAQDTNAYKSFSFIKYDFLDTYARKLDFFKGGGKQN